VLFKNMHPNYSLAKDILRVIQSIVVMIVGGVICVKFLPDTPITADILVVWIIGFAAIITFFAVRAIAVIVFRLR
jgi:hypothetical protein